MTQRLTELISSSPRNWHGSWDGSECLPGGGWMHATNHSNAQGTAFAIAYESDLSKIRMEDLVVFSVLAQYVCCWDGATTYTHLSIAHRGIDLPHTKCRLACQNVLQEDAHVLIYGYRRTAGRQTCKPSYVPHFECMLRVLPGICKDSNARSPVPLVTRKSQRPRHQSGVPMIRASA